MLIQIQQFPLQSACSIRFLANPRSMSLFANGMSPAAQQRSGHLETQLHAASSNSAESPRPYLYLLSGLDLQPIYLAICQIPSCGIEPPCVPQINEYGESAVENDYSAHSSFRLKAYNPITNLQRSRSMRDDDDGMAEISHTIQHFSLGLGVEGRCAFIEQKHGGSRSRPHAQRQGVAPGLRTSCRWCRPRLGPSGTICRRSLRRSRCGRCR